MVDEYYRRSDSRPRSHSSDSYGSWRSDSQRPISEPSRSRSSKRRRADSRDSRDSRRSPTRETKRERAADPQDSGAVQKKKERAATSAVPNETKLRAEKSARKLARAALRASKKAKAKKKAEKERAKKARAEDKGSTGQPSTRKVALVPRASKAPKKTATDPESSGKASSSRVVAGPQATAGASSGFVPARPTPKSSTRSWDSVQQRLRPFSKAKVSPTDIPVPQDRPTEVETETPEALPAEITRLEPVTGDSELVNKSPKRESPCEIDFGDYL